MEARWMKELVFEHAKATNAHYSPAVVTTDEKTVYVSGQLPIDPVTREMCTGDIREQTRKALKNVEAILAQTGGSRENIVRTTAYIDSIDNWDAVNEMYAAFFGERKPARTIVCVHEIHFGAKIEIDAVAELQKGEF